MDQNTTSDYFHSANNVSKSDNVSSDGAEAVNVLVLSMSYLAFEIGDAINKYYFLVLVPIGVIGNILSFMVIIQRHNRHLSISIYVSALAVTDTASLLIALLTNLVDNGSITFGEYFTLYCKLHQTLYMISTLSSTLIIVGMTFDRFYSIIRPHKAASFNTVKRAKFTILGITVFTILFSIPNWYTTEIVGYRCIPLGNTSIPGQIYNWLCNTAAFFFPFISLLTMNCFIIHSLRKRSKFNPTSSQKQGQGHGQKLKRSDKNIFAILLLVTFSFLLLTTPAGVVIILLNFLDYQKSPKLFADIFLFISFGSRLYVTNFAINFFLYVISGTKFRTDLVNLFKNRPTGGGAMRQNELDTMSSNVSTLTSPAQEVQESE